MNNLRLAWRNIINKPLNMILSLLLFALGIGLINFLLLINDQLKGKFESNLADIDMVVGAKGSPLQLILCNMYHIDNPTGNIDIVDAAPFFNPNHPVISTAVPLSLGDNYRSYRIVGTTYELPKLYGGEIEEGTLWKNDFEVTVGKSVADRTGLKIGDTFVSTHGLTEDDDLAHDHGQLKVVGIFKPTGTVLDQLILCTTSSVWHVHEHHDHDEDDDHVHEGDEHHHEGEVDLNSNAYILQNTDKQITSILIKYRSRSNIQALNLPRYINENTKLQAAVPAFEINKVYNLLGVGTDAIRAIAFLIALVSAISIFISLFRSMGERKYELALMRVLGGSREKLFGLILLEGVLIALLGWAVGTCLSHISMEILAGYLQSDFRYSFTGWKWLNEEWTLLGVSVLIGVVASFIPALQAYRTDINKTLSGLGG